MYSNLQSSDSKIWNIIYKEDQYIEDSEGNISKITAGSLWGRIIWDGISSWEPPEGTIAVPEK